MEPTFEEVHNWAVAQWGQMPAPHNGRVQGPSCPMCGSDTAFSIVVDPEALPPSHNGTKASRGFWSCQSDKHKNHCQLSKGGWRDLMKFQEGKPLEARERPAIAAKHVAAVETVVDAEPIEDHMEFLVGMLLSDEQALEYLWQKYGWSKELLAQQDLVGLSKKPRTVHAKRKDNGEKEMVSIDRWLTFGVRNLDGNVICYTTRSIAPFTDTHERSLLRQPDKVQVVPFNLPDVQRWAEDPDSLLLVVEGEPDVVTLKLMFGEDAYVCGIPGAKATGALNVLAPIIKKRQQRFGTKEPQVVVIPDVGGEVMAEELARRTGSSLICCAYLPTTTKGCKDITDFVNHAQWGSEQVLELLAKRERMSTWGATHVASIARTMSSYKVSNDLGFRFWVNEIDQLFSSPLYTTPHLPAGQVSVVIGPRKHRKSTLVARGALFTSFHDKVPGCITCKEMGREEQVQMLYRVWYNQEPPNFQKYAEFAQQLAQVPLYIQALADPGHATIEQYEEFVAQGVASCGWRYIVFDSLSRLIGGGEEAGRAEKWAMNMKEMAAKYGLHFITLAHVTPSDNPSFTKPLKAEQIRYIKDVLQVVDNAMSIQSVEDDGVSNEALFQLLLRRHGRSGGRVELTWDECNPVATPQAFFTRASIL